MTQLHEALALRVRDWRAGGYPSAYPAIAEIFEHAVEGEDDGRPFPQSGSLRYLRTAQLRALETYWYLRLAAGTPLIPDLYAALFPKSSARREALGLTAARLERIAIVATEFAMALEYPGTDAQFVENALVFAPGKTIIESLRELSRIPYERLLPPRLLKTFLASFKLTFTRDGDPDIPVIRGSSFNLIVTNTSMIRIQGRPIGRKALDEPRNAFAVPFADDPVP